MDGVDASVDGIAGRQQSKRHAAEQDHTTVHRLVASQDLYKR